MYDTLHSLLCGNFEVKYWGRNSEMEELSILPTRNSWVTVDFKSS